MTLVLLVAAWLAGLLLGFRVDVELLPLLLLLLAALSLGGLLRLGRHSLWPAVLPGVLLLALLRVELTDSPSTPLVTQDSQPAILQGQVISDPEVRGQRIRFVLAVEAVQRASGWQELHSKALAYADPPAPLVSIRESPFFRYGDRLSLQGTLERPQPFQGFDYPSYLANQGIQGVIWSRQVEFVSQGDKSRWRGWVFDLRRQLAENLEGTLPVAHSSLAQALLLGLRGRMPQEVVEDFRNAGTSHLLAISGLNVSMVLVMTTAAAAWSLGRRRQVYLLLPLVFIWSYALLSGLEAPATRAAITGSLYLAALALGRPQSALPALAFGAAIMTAVDPQALKRVDFQLSFAAVAAIVLVTRYQTRIAEAIASPADLTEAWWLLWLRYILVWLATAVIVSLAATLATLPLVAFNFHQIPLFGILVTILSLPVQPIILLAALATALAGLVHPLAGQSVGWLSWAPLSYQLGLVSLAPKSTFSVPWASGPMVWGWYIALGGILAIVGNGAGVLSNLKDLPGWWSRSGGRSVSDGPAAVKPTGPALWLLGVILLLAIAGIFWWLQVFSRPDGKLHVYIFDVGQGDSVLVVTPKGRQVLVDGGPEAESATRALDGQLPFWDRSVDLVVLTHLDADHSRGLLEVLDRYQVSVVLVGEEDRESALYPQWQGMLDRRKLQVVTVFAGVTIKLEEDVVLEVLNPPPVPFRGSSADRNNNAVVLRMVYGRVSFLLAADIQAPAESYLVNNAPVLASVVLKVPHHGSNTSTTAEFLRRVSPYLAVISVGAENQHRHPHPEVVERLGRALGDGGIYRTDQRGTIEFISDGSRLWIKTQR